MSSSSPTPTPPLKFCKAAVTSPSRQGATEQGQSLRRRKVQGGPRAPAHPLPRACGAGPRHSASALRKCCRWAQGDLLLGVRCRACVPMSSVASRMTWGAGAGPATSASGVLQEESRAAAVPPLSKIREVAQQGASRWAAWLPRPAPGDSEEVPPTQRRSWASPGNPPPALLLAPGALRQLVLAVPAVKTPKIQPGMRGSTCPPPPSPLQPFEPLFQVHQEPHPKANLPTLKS